MEAKTWKIHNLSKSYGDLPVLHRINLEFIMGQTYGLMGASGSGKTTLLRILLGLEQADNGTVDFGDAISTQDIVAVFQEDRLCESFSALENVMMGTNHSLSQQQIYQELCRLLPEESVLRSADTLSGGMKRRVAILRALLAPSRIILMDEPFTGLDDDTKQLVIEYIKEKTVGKLLIVTTHQEEDIVALSGTLVMLKGQ